MGIQVVRLFKRLVAEEALEWSGIDVHRLHMLLHVAARAESATAVFAHEVFLFEVDQLDVPLESCRAAELLAARCTFSSGTGTSTSARMVRVADLI